MAKAYLYVYRLNNTSNEDIANYLDSLDGVSNWFYSMPNSIFIVGDISVKDLSKKLMEKFGEHRHFLSLISRKDVAGWMPKDHWAKLPVI